MANDTGNPSSPLGRLGSITLPRQMSIYSLTLDEFQSALGEPGKNFGSMNMDELLKNIWTAEESQAMAALFGDEQQQQQQPQQQQQQDQAAGPSPSSLVRQNSVIQRQNSVTLLPLPQELSKKTVDEVWKTISGPSNDGGVGAVAAAAGSAAAAAAASTSAAASIQQTGRQTTYGEMTLEDFLVKAGVMTAEVNPSPLSAIQGFPVASTTMNQMAAAAPKPILGGMTGMISKKEPIELNDPVLGIGLGASSSYSAVASSSNGYLTPAQAAARQQAEWMESQYKNSTALAQQQQMLQLGYMNGGAVQPGSASVMHASLAGYSKEGSPGSPLSDAQGYGLSPNGTGFGFEGGLRGRKRILDAPLEKIVERRQRRMIKNRESAARSRARKQAYTVELEAEVSQLKEENMKLRKQQEEENMKKRKQLIGSMTQHLPKGLRRTLTGPW